MRGRKPSVLSLAPSDEDRLHTTADSDSLPWYQVRRARILLALAAGQRKRDVAAQMECGVATVWRACERYRRDGLEGLLADGREGRSGRLEQITPVQRAQIVELACLEPIAKGLHITHWSSEDLARQAVEDGIVGSISPATVRRLLHDVDLQPHRTRCSRSHPESGCILNRLPRNPRYFSVNSWMIVNISYDRYLSLRTVVDFGSCKVFSMVFV